MTNRISILISCDLNSFNLKCLNKNLIKYGVNFHSWIAILDSSLSSRALPGLNSEWSSRTSSNSVLSSLCRTDRSRSLSPTTSSSTRKGSTSCAWCSRLWINSTMTSFAPSVRVSNFSVTKGVCLEIVNCPVECDNPDCGQLYCTYCLSMKLYDKNLQQDDKVCEVCKNVGGGYRKPSPLVTKMFNKYLIKCMTCNKAFKLSELG